MVPRPHTPAAAVVLSLVLTLLALINPAAAQEKTCKGKQSYIFTVTTSFTPNVDPQIPQEKAVIPVMVAVAHKKPSPLFAPAQFLTDAVAEVITSGTTDKIEPELREMMRNKTISSYEIIAKGRDQNIPVQDETKFDLELRDGATQVTIIAPLSPSPDWFIGTTEDLCRNGQFVERRNNIEFKNYNAGLKKGTNWDSNVDPLDVREPVSILQDQIELTLASVNAEKGSLGTNWWRILLIVLAVVAVLAFAGYFLLMRLKKKRPSDLPLTTNEGVEW